MRKRRDRKGVSTAFITIVLIAMAIVATGIIWGIVSGIFSSSKENVEYAQSKVALKVNAVGYDESTYIVSVKVVRAVGSGPMEGIRFIFFDGEKSKIIDNKTVLSELEEKTFYFHLYDTIQLTRVTKISVAPIISVSSGASLIGNTPFTYQAAGSSGSSGSGNGSSGGGLGPSGDGGEIGGEDLGGACQSDSDCGYDEKGSEECGIDNQILAYWTAYTCNPSIRVCISSQDVRVSQICSGGCYVENATCIDRRFCTDVSTCGESGDIGLPFCDVDNVNVYQNYRDYFCEGGVCSNEVTRRMKQDCLGYGCSNGVCNPGPECSVDSECPSYPGSWIPLSEFCPQNEQRKYINESWASWISPSCENEFKCVASVSVRLKENCSEKEPVGEWVCFMGQCLEKGACLYNDDCECGNRCVEEKCVVEDPLNDGTQIVEGIWPFDLAEHFTSRSLPTEEDVDYDDFWVKFSGSEQRCLRIRDYVIPTPPGTWSYIRFDLTNSTVSIGDKYQIWETRFNCECTAPLA